MSDIGPVQRAALRIVEELGGNTCRRLQQSRSQFGTAISSGVDALNLDIGRVMLHGGGSWELHGLTVSLHGAGFRSALDRFQSLPDGFPPAPGMPATPFLTRRRSFTGKAVGPYTLDGPIQTTSPVTSGFSNTELNSRRITGMLLRVIAAPRQ